VHLADERDCHAGGSRLAGVFMMVVRPTVLCVFCLVSRHRCSFHLAVHAPVCLLFVHGRPPFGRSVPPVSKSARAQHTAVHVRWGASVFAPAHSTRHIYGYLIRFAIPPPLLLAAKLRPIAPSAN
jgi:hypothetical protein